MFTLYFLPYFLMMFGVVESTLFQIVSLVLMGLGMAGIGLSIMHDANHGTFSRRPYLNKFMSYFSMETLGGSSLNWRIQHNVLHHSFTNIHGMDEDIDTIPLLRFSPNEERKSIHRFQFLYAGFFYGLMTMSWMTQKDFINLRRYNKENLLQTQGTTLKKELTKLIFFKILYYGYICAIPLIVLNINFWQWLLGFAIMHFVSGTILSYIFQSAHVMPETTFVTKETINEENSWAIHQLATTANFSNWNPLFTWYVGGLNYQIEHHLFPDISHVHYPKISKIVRSMTKEYNIPYHYHRTFGGAVWAHYKMLYSLGKA